MDDFDDLKLSDSDDDEGAGERVRMIMEEIYKNQDKIKSEKDIEEMAERCTNMMTQMRNEAYLKKKDKKGQRSSGAGDKASPPSSRISSLKESPRKDSTKAAGSPPYPPQNKAALKSQMDYKKKSPKPNFSDLYKEKMEKMRVPGKMDLKGSQTKTDSTKTSDSLQEEPVLWGLNKKTSTKLDEAHFKDAVNKLKESGISLKGSEDDPSVDRIINTIADEDSSDGSVTDINTTSTDSDVSDREVSLKEKLAVEKLLKDLERKKEDPYGAVNIADLRKPYMSWLEKKKSSLKLGGHTTKDGITRKKKKERGDEKELKILSSESEPSCVSSDTSEVESNPDDPFSLTPEGKDIMRKMKKIKTKSTHKVEESDLKKKMRQLSTESRGFRPSLEGIDVSKLNRPPIDWCTLAKAQAESKNQRGWIGEVKNVEEMWFRDICAASKRAHKSGEPLD